MKRDAGAEASRLEVEERHLIHELPLRARIFLPTEVIPLTERVAGLKRVRAIYEWWWKREYAPRLRDLRRRYKDRRRCFIIGNGPSLNHTDLSKLRDEVTFGVNGLFLKFDEMGFHPTFYVVEDHLVAEDRAAAINAIEGPLKLFPFTLAYCLDEGPDTLFFNHRPRPSLERFEFSTDASRVTYTGCTVTFTCMQLAFYFGFREIYLVGVDARYEIPKAVERTDHYGVTVLDMQGDDPNHFHPDYFGKGYRWHDPQVDKMIAAYEEARRATEAHGVRIRNATIGGKLEAFERVDYESLFRPMVGAGGSSPLPRVLILDMTCLGSSSATGQLKKTLFSGWPEDRLAQVFAAGDGRFGLYRDGGVAVALDDPRDPAEAIAWCQSFDPDVVYFRPHDHPVYFHEFALCAIDALGVPLVTHLMDDWPARAASPGLFAKGTLVRRLPEVLARSAVRLSICEAMSRAFETRYGVLFQAIANAVEPADWQALDGERAARRAGTEPLLIRYVGALADDMGFASVSDVARAVDARHEELGVCFEIYTAVPWKSKAEAEFRKLRGVSVREAGFSEEVYRRYLIGCHLLLIAYNFDADSIAYVRYSMANKMPECLASGTPVLAYGPTAVATIAYLAEHQVAEVVATRDPVLLQAAIRRLAADPDMAMALGTRGRAFAFERHRAAAVRERLHEGLSDAAKRHGWASGVKPKAADDAGLIGCAPRSRHAHVDEAGLVGEVLAEVAGGVMLDVGAHHGGALSGFLKRGWSVYGFEPDPANRAALRNRFGDQPGLVIDPRAVSDRVAAGVVFYASSESTGIGTLKPFRDSHRPVCEVATTTVQEVVEARGFTRIDFLKVDTEGYDLMVLRGVPWGHLRPRVVLCEFEDRKTGPLGYTFHDLARYLIAQGYRVWVSEWHPVLRYGIRHDWRRLLPYPCHLGDPDAWGNLIAFREAADEKALAQAARMAIERPSPTRSIPLLGLTVQRGVTKVKGRAGALTKRARAGLIAYLDGHHPDAAASLRAALRRLRSSPM